MSSRNSDSESNPNDRHKRVKSSLTTSGAEHLMVDVALPSVLGNTVERDIRVWASASVEGMLRRAKKMAVTEYLSYINELGRT